MIMKNVYVLITLLLLAQPLSAQFPPLEINLDQVEASVNGLAEASLRAGTNWQNITEIRGSIIFDPMVVDEPVLIFWGLSNPGGALIQDQGGGVLTYQWESLISIGPTLNPGDVVFTLQFEVTGGVGSATPLDFSSTPEPLFWANGFGWSGNNHSISNGSVTIVVGDDLIFKSDFDP